MNSKFFCFTASRFRYLLQILFQEKLVSILYTICFLQNTQPCQNFKTMKSIIYIFMNMTLTAMLQYTQIYELCKLKYILHLQETAIFLG